MARFRGRQDMATPVGAALGAWGLMFAVVLYTPVPAIAWVVAGAGLTGVVLAAVRLPSWLRGVGAGLILGTLTMLGLFAFMRGFEAVAL